MEVLYFLTYFLSCRFLSFYSISFRLCCSCDYEIFGFPSQSHEQQSLAPPESENWWLALSRKKTQISNSQFVSLLVHPFDKFVSILLVIYDSFILDFLSKNVITLRTGGGCE